MAPARAPDLHGIPIEDAVQQAHGSRHAESFSRDRLWSARLDCHSNFACTYVFQDDDFGSYTRKCVEQRQAARRGHARSHRFETGLGHRCRARSGRHETQLECGDATSRRLRHEKQRHGEIRADRSHRVQWMRVLLIVGDQSHRYAIRRNLRGSFEQACREARVVTAQARRWLLRSGRNAPVAGRRVMHRVVKARR